MPEWFAHPHAPYILGAYAAATALLLRDALAPRLSLRGLIGRLRRRIETGGSR